MSSGDLEKQKNAPTQCKFAWKNISYGVETTSGRKQILENVSGHVRSGIFRSEFLLMTGQLLGVMGPSGCGKTTLLNILSRRLNNLSVTGEQLLDGSPFGDETLRKTSTYVEQEDHLIGSLTVHETVEFAAKLALPRDVSAQERLERTDEILRAFGLWPVKDSKIGTPLQRGISRGQQRRVTTASQLITQPKIIFLGTSNSGIIAELKMSRLPDSTAQARTK